MLTRISAIVHPLSMLPAPPVRTAARPLRIRPLRPRSSLGKAERALKTLGRSISLSHLGEEGAPLLLWFGNVGKITSTECIVAVMELLGGNDAARHYRRSTKNGRLDTCSSCARRASRTAPFPRPTLCPSMQASYRAPNSSTFNVRTLAM
jgi:hypothetical protein